MKILVVQESDWIKRNPHQQHHLMERLHLRGHEIRVIDYDIDWRKEENRKTFTKRKEYEISKIFGEAKIKVIRPSTLKIAGMDYVSILFSHRKEIEKQIKEFQPDVIIGFGILNSYIACKIAKKHGIPFVYYWIDVLHTLIPTKSFQSIGKYIEKITIKNSSYVITINKKLAEFVTKLGARKEKTKVIGAGIDLEKFNPEKFNSKDIRKKYKIGENDIILFFMGWLYHFSGLKEVALTLTKFKNNKIKLLIVGEGDAYNDLIKIRERYKLYDKIILTGKQPYDKIPEFIASADICILPAYPDEEIMQDIVPIKMYEYMAMGKPVITTKLPGIMKEFGNNNGVIYVDKPGDVIEKAIELIESGQIKEEEKKARKFVEKYDWNNIVDEFEKTLETLI